MNNDSAPSARTPAGLPLFADLYEITMAQAYFAAGMHDTAVFELSYRTLPRNRGYVVVAGLGGVLGELEALRFDADALEYLRSLGSFDEAFLQWLSRLRFTGDVAAVPEGTVVFPNEPILQVVAPIAEGQIIETFVINQMHFQSVIASKAARVVDAAAGRAVIDFGSRRAHGIDAGIQAARASHLVGAVGTSNLAAGRRYGIPVFGTMAHSYVQAFDDEEQAFATFARLYPKTTLLVDTYDTLEAIDRIIALAQRGGETLRIGAVRLDSGDLVALSREARRRLDAAGLSDVELFASSGLDEHTIAHIVGADAPIDGFGVGTKLTVSTDAPELDMAYKLVEYAGRRRTKLSEGKVILPGRKQVFRVIEDGCLHHDVIARFDERRAGRPLLEPVMRRGRVVEGLRLSPSDALAPARAHWKDELRCLPPELRRLHGPYPEPRVVVSDAVAQALQDLRSDLRPPSRGP